MRSLLQLSALSSLLSAALAATGPYAPAGPTTNSALPRHTIYRPQGGNPGSLPVLIWGNGACSADGTSVSGFLSEIASYGYLVISQGTPGGGGSSTVDQMRQAVSWAANGAGGAFQVDTSKIMTAGYSCGGTEAYEFANDDRVSSIGILNSGLLGNYDFAGTIRKPMIFMLGGSSDIAYPNGERDYSRLPSGTPAWKGNINRVGHGGTYYESNGGLYAKAMVNWLNWLFKGQSSGLTYLQSQAAGDGWSSVISKSLNNVQVPIGGGGGGGGDDGGGDGGGGDDGGSDGGGQGCSTPLYGQCGGSGFGGCKTCAQGSTCKFSNDWYSQCLP